MALPNMAMIPSGYKPTKLYSVLPTPSLGSEEITNGDFSNGSTDWTLSGLTVISNGVASFVDNGTNTNSGIAQNSLVVGKQYKVAFNVSRYVSGRVQVSIGGSSNEVDISNGVGTYNIYLESSSVQFLFKRHGGYPNFDFDIDDISVKEVFVGDADFDVTRATPATRVNQQGLIETPEFIESGDLVTNGDFSDGSTDWSIDNTTGSSTNITNGVLNIVSDGAITQASQSNVMITGKQYKVTLDVISTNGAKLANSSGSNIYDTSTVGTKVFYIIATNSSFYLKRRAGVTDVSVDNVSVIQVERNNIPRLDYTDGTCPVLLIEPQSTNLIQESQNFSSSYWAKQNGGTGSLPIVTSNYSISPNGTQDADRVIFNLNGGTANADVSQLAVSIGAVSSSSYTNSVYIKSNTANDYDLVITKPSGGFVTKTISTEWQRFDTPDTTVTNVSIRIRLRGDESTSDYADVSIWGAQVEELPYSTSIIPTNGSISTRNKDIVNNAGTSATYNSVEGVLFAEIAALADDLTFRSISLNDGTNTNSVGIRYRTSSNRVNAIIKDGNGVNLQMQFEISDITQFNKIALKYKSGDVSMYINGIEVATSSSTFSLTSALNDLSFDRGDGGDDFFGKTSQVQVFNTALSDFDLQNLTSNATAYASYETMRTSLNFNIQ